MPIQYAYKDREIEIVVSDAVDETDYFLGTDANRTRTVREPYANRTQVLGAIRNIGWSTKRRTK